MKSRHRLIFSVCLALLSGTCLSAPSLAQKGDAAALSAKINELGRAGKYAEAVATLKMGQSKPGGNWCALDSELGYIYARRGETNQAQQIIAALGAREQTEFIDPYIYAMIYAGLGDAQKVFEFLERACDKRSMWISSFRSEPKFTPYRNDPNYQRILARLKLSPASRGIE
jgi:tetratricopeptide (TPR) repeat protein